MKATVKMNRNEVETIIRETLHARGLRPSGNIRVVISYPDALDQREANIAPDLTGIEFDIEVPTT